MSCQDPVSMAIVSIRNALKARKDFVMIPGSKLKTEIIKILLAEGFIKDYKIINNKNSFELKVMLKYDENGGVISEMKRVSKLSRRMYLAKGEVKPVRNGMGIAILTTSHGIMTDLKARQLGIGGEIICTVW